MLIPRYLGLLAKEVWRHAVSWLHFIVILGLIALGWAGLLLPRAGMSFNAGPLQELLENPATYAVLFGSIVGVRLFCAPYWVWKEEYLKRKTAEEAVAPRVSFSLMPEIIHEEGGRCALVLIKNVGAHSLSNCQVTVDNFPVCRSFSLRPDETKHIPIFQFTGENGTMGTITTWSNITGVWARSDLVIRLQNAEYKVRVLADDSMPRSMTVRAALNGDWSVVPIA